MRLWRELTWVGAAHNRRSQILPPLIDKAPLRGLLLPQTGTRPTFYRLFYLLQFSKASKPALSPGRSNSRAARYARFVAAVVFKLADRYGLDEQQAQFLAGQLKRRLTVPEHVARLADEIWAQSMRNPDAGETSRDIELDYEQKRELAEVMSRVQPDGDATAWNALRDALVADVAR